MKTVFMATALSLIAVSNVAPAQDAPRGGGGMMRADTNGDGAISRDEYTAGLDSRFAQMDANHDGTLTPDEMTGMGGGGRGGRPHGDAANAAPTRGPAAAGPMTKDAFRANAMKRFDQMDANHDGKIDHDEMAAMMQRFGGGGGGNGGAGGGRHRAGPAGDPPSPADQEQ